MKLKWVNKDYLVDKETTNCYYKDHVEVLQWLKEGNTPEPEFSEEEIVAQEHIQFRAERDSLLSKVDIAINKAEDLGQDTKDLRVYRQCLRDATKDWTMPESIL